MGVLTRPRRGWAMSIDSARVLVRDPELLAFPVLGTLAVAAVGVTAVGVVVLPGALALAGVLPLLAVLLLLYPAGQAVTGVAKAALYLYAVTGEQPAAFRDVDFARALE